MSFVVSILITVQILAAVAMIGLVLIQHGKGADMGAAFGCTLALAYFGNAKPASTGSVLENPAATAPATPETASQIPGAAPAGTAPASEPAVPVAPGPAQIPAR